jgi:aspartate/methionine/tyrosine aminotransferase
MIPPFHVMEVMKAAAELERQTGDVLHLEVGQPSTPAPTHARRAAAAAIGGERLGYTEAVGTRMLRERIAALYPDRYGVEVDADRVVVTAGASGGFVLTLLAAFDAGDRVGITEPGYAAYRNIVSALDLQLVGIRVGPETGFLPTIEDLERVGPLTGFILASPSNPTGTMVGQAALVELAGWCAANDVRLLSDEIYHGITFEKVEATAAVFDDAVVVQSFSKYQSMTGWRVGWLVLPTELVRPVERLAQNLFISPGAVSQVAALASFESFSELDENVARYRANRDILTSALRACGLDRIAPADGAFYLWVDVSDIAPDSQDLCRRWLRETGVACTPGIDFDPLEGHRFVRMSYSESTADITEASRRLSEWVAHRG